MPFFYLRHPHCPLCRQHALERDGLCLLLVSEGILLPLRLLIGEERRFHLSSSQSGGSALRVHTFASRIHCRLRQGALPQRQALLARYCAHCTDKLLSCGARGDILLYDPAGERFYPLEPDAIGRGRQFWVGSALIRLLPGRGGSLAAVLEPEKVQG